MLLAQDVTELIADIGSKMFPSWESLVVQLLATGIMFLVILKFFYKPIKANIDERKNHIQKIIDEAQKSKEQAHVLYDKRQEQLKDAHVEARKIIENAQIQAKREYEEQLVLGNQQIEINKEKALHEVEQERIAARKEIHDEIVNVALLAASKIVEREIDDQDNQKLVDQFLEGLNDER